jgi:protein-L-isoaspartate(D-aspartate) O-methyltransferase
MTDSINPLEQVGNTVWSIQSARHKMIEQQIRPWGILDKKYLEVFEVVKREMFVENSQIHLAFSDLQLPIHGSPEVMLEPRIEARILQALAPQGKDEVLEIGTGSGYMAALLAHFSKMVKSIEIRPDLIDFSVSNLQRCHIPNVRVERGDALKGWQIENDLHFDVICISGGILQVSEGLKSQLKVGGRLFAFIGKEPMMQAILMKRVSKDHFETQTIFETLVPSLQFDHKEFSTFEF